LPQNQNIDMSMAENKSGYQKIYDRLADRYDLVYGRILSRGHKLAIKAMALNGPHKILEVGIGTGLTLSHYPKHADITGIDISDAMLEIAREKIKDLKLTNAKVKTMSAEKLEYDDNSFDRVFAPSVISAVAQPGKVIEEMIRVCKHGGHICIVSHFAGKKVHDKLVDLLSDSLTQKFLGFRMTTPLELVEKNTRVEVVMKDSIFPVWKNFSRLYILKKF